MATLMEELKLQDARVDEAAQLHNAQINERYRRLQNAEADQFAAPTQPLQAEPVFQTEPVLAPVETPAVEQTPQVTEYLREYAQSPLFTVEKLDRIQQLAQETVQEAETVTVQTATVQEAQYSLSNMAKAVLAAFTAFIVLMLTIIGINSRIISRNEVEIQALELRREQLLEENAEIRALIERAQSDEVIRQFAIENGMIAG